MDEPTEPNVVLNIRTKKYKKKRKLILIDEDEHNYGEIENIEQPSTTILPSKKILTEDLGKMFEMAICMSIFSTTLSFNLIILSRLL